MKEHERIASIVDQLSGKKPSRKKRYVPDEEFESKYKGLKHSELGADSQDIGQEEMNEPPNLEEKEGDETPDMTAAGPVPTDSLNNEGADDEENNSGIFSRLHKHPALHIAIHMHKK
jgi:hypothetical protein